MYLNKVERYRFFKRVKSFISYKICKFAGIFDSVSSIPNNKRQNSRKIAEVGELTKEIIDLNRNFRFMNLVSHKNMDISRHYCITFCTYSH